MQYAPLVLGRNPATAPCCQPQTSRQPGSSFLAGNRTERPLLHFPSHSQYSGGRGPALPNVRLSVSYLSLLEPRERELTFQWALSKDWRIVPVGVDKKSREGAVCLDAGIDANVITHAHLHPHLVLWLQPHHGTPR